MQLPYVPRHLAARAATAILLSIGCSNGPTETRVVSSIAVTPKTARIWILGDSVKFTADIQAADGKPGEIPVTWTSRDPTLLSVTPGGYAKTLRKGGSTYVVATAGGKSDSALVDAPTSPCSGLAPTTMSVGQVVTDIGATGFCVGDFPFAEYTIVAVNSSLTATASAAIEVIGQGLSTPPSTSGPQLASRASFVRATDLRSRALLRRNVVAESQLRAAETAALTPLVAAAQQWYRSRPHAALRAAAPPVVGDIISMNVSVAGASCASTMRDTRVAAVSPSAIVLSDVNNPSGGFTDTEYAAIADQFNTVINPLDTTTFGAPTDLDNNGHVILLFTSAINALTPANAQSYIAGQTMQRDLFPKTTTGDKPGCAGSNVGEVFYLLVSDPNGAVNGFKEFTHDFVLNQTASTVVHEYQHLINYSRRMYLLGLTSDKWADLIWLHEGLSHSAEELLFHQSSGLATRTNINIGNLRSSDQTLNAFNNDMIGNFFLYDSYAVATATSSPYRQDGDLTTRGATWAFLRYLMDQRSATDGKFLYDLVNSGDLGLTNLENRLGATPAQLQGLVRDFAVAVYADDYVAGMPDKYAQPSWNMRSIYPGFNDPTFFFPLVGHKLTDNTASAITLAGGGFAVYRFRALPGTDAFIRATGSAGSQMPPAITLSIIRTQ